MPAMPFVGMPYRGLGPGPLPLPSSARFVHDFPRAETTHFPYPCAHYSDLPQERTDESPARRIDQQDKLGLHAGRRRRAHRRRGGPGLCRPAGLPRRQPGHQLRRQLPDPARRVGGDWQPARTVLFQADSYDALFQQIVDSFGPQVSFVLKPKQLVKVEPLKALNRIQVQLGSLSPETGGYVLVDFSEALDDELQAVLVYRNDLARVLELAVEIGIYAAPAYEALKAAQAE